MPAIFEIFFENNAVRNRIKTMVQHKTSWIIIIAHNCICLGLCAYSILKNITHERDWLFYSFVIYSLSSLYKLSLLLTRRLSIPGFTIFQILVAEADGNLSIFEINVMMLDVIVIVFFILMLRFTSFFDINNEDLFYSLRLLVVCSNMIFSLETVILMSVFVISKMANLSFSETLFRNRDTSLENGDGESRECAICKESFNTEEMVKRLKCKHLFHSSCIDEWFSITKNCPLCKQDGLEGNSIRSILSR